MKLIRAAANFFLAFSLIQTGMDEHGNLWPIHFQSFNDYKPGLYFYIVFPFVKFFGLTEWSVRIPGAFFGVATVYLVYLLVLELFEKHLNRHLIFNILHPGLIAAFLLAINPWHLHFSRGGWEVNVATFFITLGVYLVLRSLNKPSFLNFSLFIISFTLSLYTYHAARIVVPLLGLGILIILGETMLTLLREYSFPLEGGRWIPNFGQTVGIRSPLECSSLKSASSRMTKPSFSGSGTTRKRPSRKPGERESFSWLISLQAAAAN